jgi:glycerol-3-phosphate dehydrogenase
MNATPSLAATLHADLPYTGAEVVWAARHEMARTIEDVLAGRTRALFLNARAAEAMAPAVARLMATELDWDEAPVGRSDGILSAGRRVPRLIPVPALGS